MPVCRALAHRADEPRAPLALQREDGEKVGRVQRDLQLAVHRRSPRCHVRDIKEVSVCAARESNLQRLAHDGVRAIAFADEGGLASFHGSVRPFQTREHTTGRLLEAEERRRALDVDAGLGQTVDQQTFVLVLRKDQRVGNGLRPAPMSPKTARATFLPATQSFAAAAFNPLFDDGVSEADLVIELQRPCLHGDGARRRPRLRVVSTIRTRTPRRVSHRANTRPIGPAPTIRTSHGRRA